MQTPKLLIVDDNEDLIGTLERVLGRDFAVTTASNRADAVRAFGEGPDAVLLDIRLVEADVEDRSGIELLREFLAAQPSLPVIMFSGFNDVETAVECMRLGATDFIHKSASNAEVLQRLKTALEHARLSRRVRQLEERLQQIDPAELVGESAQMARVKEAIQMVALDGYATVLLRGETGTGKELAARAVHRVGRRSGEPFVPVAVAALNPNLVESELFGHEAGAFTGAKERRVGFVERAKRGVLFLDEVGELPAEAQLKLLRFLEDRRFSRVGSSDEIEIDVQIVAATNRDLEEAIAGGRIREDLYFRLKSVQVFLPPLRERIDDLPLLVSKFLQQFREQGRTRIAAASDEAMRALARYHWPGNVRELKAALERAIIYANYSGHQSVEREDLPREILEPAGAPRPPAARVTGRGVSLDRELARTELAYVEEALRLTEERKTEAWKLLGLNDRFALRRRIKALLRAYPELAPDFPTVRRLYGREPD